MSEPTIPGEWQKGSSTIILKSVFESMCAKFYLLVYVFFWCQVCIEPLSKEDLLFIVSSLYPMLDHELVKVMITFNYQVCVCVCVCVCDVCMFLCMQCVIIHIAPVYLAFKWRPGDLVSTGETAHPAVTSLGTQCKLGK